MADFSDVARFAQEHRACGAIVPNVTPQPTGGYLLTLTCRCGAVFNRWVTPEDAKSAPTFGRARGPESAAPSSAPPKRRAATPEREASGERPHLTPSPELQALISNLAAEATSRPPEASRPGRSKAGRPPIRASGDVEAALKTALRTSASGKGGPDVGILGAILSLQSAEGSHGRRDGKGRATGRVVLLLVSAILAGGLIWWLMQPSGSVAPPAPSSATGPTAVPTTPLAPQPAPPTSLAITAEDRRTLDAAVEALRQLQSVSLPGNSLPFYRSRVAMAGERVQPFVDSAAPEHLRAMVRDILEIHGLAATLWGSSNADATEAPRVDERILQSCASGQRVLELSERARAADDLERKTMLAAALPLLWDCAAERLTQMDKVFAGG